MSTDRPQRTVAAGAGAGGVHAIFPPAPAAGAGAQALASRLRDRARQALGRFGVRRTRFAYAAAAVAALAVLWTALIVRDLQAQVDAETAATQHSLENVTEVGVHAMVLAVRGADMLLTDLRDEWENHRWHFRGLVKMRQDHPAIGFDFDITVLDRDGGVTFSTFEPQDAGTDYAKLPLVARLRGASSDVLSISAVRLAGPRPVMDLARRLTTSDGVFDGVVICSVPSDYLRSQFSDVALEPGTTLTVVRRDGRVLLQLANRGGRTLTDSSPAPSSVATYDASHPDGVERVLAGVGGRQQLIAWRDAHGYPFTFVVARPTDTLDATVRQLRWRYGVVVTVLSAAVLAGLYRLARHQELRERAAREQAEHVQALTQAQSALAASERELRELSSHHLVVKEAEHRRVAQEIHDELGQRLTVHRMDLAMLPETVRGKPERELTLRVAAMKADVDAMLAIVRDIARQLRPGALEIGLAAAVESMLHEVQTRLGLRCEFANRLPAGFTTDDTRATTAFRIVQEAVTNAVRHARPSFISVVLNQSADRLLIAVQDDGAGFDQQAQGLGYGLGGMRQRAQALGGVLRIRSVAGQGTTVEAEIPLQGELEAATRIPAPQAPMNGSSR